MKKKKKMEKVKSADAVTVADARHHGANGARDARLFIVWCALIMQMDSHQLCKLKVFEIR